jgi:hypothetical protein
MDSEILNWTNKTCFREKLPVGSLGSKDLTTSERSLTKAVLSQLLKFTVANLHHAVTAIICLLLNFVQVSVKLKGSEVTERL